MVLSSANASGELAAHLVKLACDSNGITFVKPTLRKVMRVTPKPRTRRSMQQAAQAFNGNSKDGADTISGSDSATAESIQCIDLTSDHTEDEAGPTPPKTHSRFRRLYKR